MKHIRQVEKTKQTETAVVNDVAILEAAFKRINQEYDWYIADDLFSRHNVSDMSDKELDKALVEILEEYGVC